MHVSAYNDMIDARWQAAEGAGAALRQTEVSLTKYERSRLCPVRSSDTRPMPIKWWTDII